MHHRKLVKGLALIAGLSALATSSYAQRGGGRGPAPPPAPLKVMPISGGVYWASGGAGANTGFIVGTSGVIVIDSKMTVDSEKEMLAEIAKVTPKPVTHVILTHSDPDHINGLAAFPKGLTIIAQENCKKEMEEALSAATPANAALRDYLPTQTISKNEDVTLDGMRLRLLHFGPGHTSGDLMVYVPEQKVVFAGDILTMQFPLPFIHREKHGTPEGLIANMKGMLALKATAYVPGHGDLQTQAPLEKRLVDTEARLAEVKKLFAAGKSLGQVEQNFGESTTPPPAGTFVAPSFTEVAFREISANQPYPPHDLSGVWYIRGVGFSMTRTSPPMTAWGQARYDAAKPGLGARGHPLGNDPIMGCDPMGLLRSIVWGVYPTEFIQTPKETLMLFDWFYTRRAIWTDGRKLPVDPEPRFDAYSIGHWDGDTFVVESNGFDDRVWADADGHPISTDAQMEERYHRLDHDAMDVSITLTDPKSYTEPWVSKGIVRATLVSPAFDRTTVMREDLCIPSAEAKYKEEVREPAGEKK